MTNPEFQNLIDETIKALGAYQNILNECENEYKKRYGKFPSEWDDDYWIDGLHVKPSPVTIEGIEANIIQIKNLTRFHG